MKIVRVMVVTSLLATALPACSGDGSGAGNAAGDAGSSLGGAPVSGSGGAAAGSAGTGAGAGGSGLPGSAGASGSAGAGAAGQSGGGGNGLAGNGGAGGSAACVPLVPISRRLLSLEPAQFGNATRDLLSLSAAPDVQEISDVPPALGTSRPIDGPYLYALYLTAGSAVAQVAPRAAALAACGAGESDADCATRFAASFGRKAFRRTLDDVEVADILGVFATVCPGPSPSCASPADFAAAITLMVKAFILAPSFLYRTELGPRSLAPNAAGVYPDTSLTADEVATQLAFLLLGSTPDAGLLAAADSGALRTQAGILSEVNRLLALPAAQSTVNGMVARWLGLDRLAVANKDPALLSALTPADQDQVVIVGDLRVSWDRAVTAALWSSPPGKVTDLLTSPTFFADPRLALLYGLQPGATSNTIFSPISWPAAEPRAGILTHPAFLWAISDPANTSIVKRGQVIHDDIVCGDPVAPEPDLSTPEGLAVIKMGDSEATRSDARLASGKLCADSCHSELDPYGRLLQAFDAIGNYRTVDEAGRPIDPSAKLTASSPLGATTVAGPVAFASALVSSKVFAGCAVERLFEVSMDVPVPGRNTCQVNDLRAAFDQSDGTMASLLRGIVLSDFAHARAGGPP
jgi:hypothetical protein